MGRLKLGFKFNGASLPFPKAHPVGSSPASRAQQKVARAEESRQRQKRSDQLRFKAIIKKFGLDRAAELGVPQDIIEAAKRAAARRARRQQGKRT